MAIQNTAAAMPSRAFLVQQAVLSADAVYGSDPSKKYLSRAERLHTYTLGDWVRPSFCAIVRAEFNALVRRHASLGRRAA